MSPERALGGKPLAATRAATGDDAPAADSGHASTKAVAALADEFAGLIGALHGTGSDCGQVKVEAGCIRERLPEVNFQPCKVRSGGLQDRRLGSPYAEPYDKLDAMIGRKASKLAPWRSLSARLLVLTAVFIMLGEFLIFAPSVARWRLSYLESRIASSHLAILALEATPDNMVSQDLADELLAHVGAHGIVLSKPNNTRLMIDAEEPPPIDAVYDLRTTKFFESISDAFVALAQTHNRVLRVLAISPKDPRTIVEVLLDEAPMVGEMWDFGRRVLELSIVISLIAGTLVYLSLEFMLVRPLRRLSNSMVAFREDPEDESRVIVPSPRGDEIGLAQRELATMQETIRQSLRQNARLAALGTAVTKINHDLRNILSTARLVSDGLAESDAPEVRRVAPRLLAAIDRAVALCSRTLDYTRDGAPPLYRRHFSLAALIDDLSTMLDPPDEGGPNLACDVAASLEVEADRDQLYRALYNLCRNASEAGAQRIQISARLGIGIVAIDISDDGPGLSPKARDNLFRPFAGSARAGGTGLGLAIAREVVRAHGGDLMLVDSTGEGTIFRLTLPAPEPGNPPLRRRVRRASRAPEPRP